MPLHTKKVTQFIKKHQKMTRQIDSQRREIGKDTQKTEGPTADDPPRKNRDLNTGQGWQGGDNGKRTHQQNQARGTGRRDNRRRLTGGAWGKSTGGRHTTPR